MSLDADYEEALAAEDGNRFEEALRRYDAVLAACPADTALARLARFRRCCVLHDLGRWQEVLDALPNGRRGGRRMTAGFAVLGGMAASELGDWERAKKSFRESLHVDPKAAHVWCLLAAAHDQLGEFEEQASCLQRALELDPDFGEIHLHLGLVAKFEGDLTRAKECFERAVALDPECAAGHAELGLMLLREDPEAAERALVRARELDPARFWTRVYLGVLHYGAKRYEESALECAEAIRISESSLAHTFLGDALAALGRDTEAEASFRRALELADASERRRAHLRLGGLLVDVGREEEGREQLRIAESLEADDPENGLEVAHPPVRRRPNDPSSS